MEENLYIVHVESRESLGVQKSFFVSKEPEKID